MKIGPVPNSVINRIKRDSKLSRLFNQNLNKNQNNINNPQNKKANRLSAKDVFLNFHKSITNKQYKQAYNILSPDYQHFIGGYDKFTPGYKTTISSEIVEIQGLAEDANVASFSYELKAVDREGNGTKIQYFAGKAKHIRINNQWRLDSTEAKRL